MRIFFFYFIMIKNYDSFFCHNIKKKARYAIL